MVFISEMVLLSLAGGGGARGAVGALGFQRHQVWRVEEQFLWQLPPGHCLTHACFHLWHRHMEIRLLPPLPRAWQRSLYSP
jgi:hypothetical protein